MWGYIYLTAFWLVAIINVVIFNRLDVEDLDKPIVVKIMMGIDVAMLLAFAGFIYNID